MQVVMYATCSSHTKQQNGKSLKAFLLSCLPSYVANAVEEMRCKLNNSF
jgi:hypothetical protein